MTENLLFANEIESDLAPYVYIKLSPTKPTVVFDTYWKFAAERQNIFFKRVRDEAAPWTQDAILRKYKFTNVYRITDRVSQYLVRNVIYNSGFPSSNAEVFFRIMLFKLFNKIETWEMLLSLFGELTYESFDIQACDKALLRCMQAGVPIYSAAYIMASGKSYFGHEKKHTNHLFLIKKMMEEKVYEQLEECSNMQRAFELLKSYPSIGDFLAYQYVIDINYSDITDFSESEFVVPGPGAKSGISKCFSDTGGLTEVEIIKLMTDRQEIEFDRLGLHFQMLGPRPLQLIDCQNIFCETDKYSRLKHPTIKGIGDRQRIKQTFVTSGKTPVVFLPPKWNIDHF
jgi:hypothetical protein